MKQKTQTETFIKNKVIFSLFPTPLYLIHRPINLDSTEEKEIEDIVNDTEPADTKDYVSKDMYIFDTKLKKLKEFIEHNIKIYVEEILNPKEELDFYITQSWVNVTTQALATFKHHHQNSIISGVFYVSVKENDKIQFYNRNSVLHQMGFDSMEYNSWTASAFTLEVSNNTLILFPSWLEHNAFVVGHRISIAFNVFAKGMFGTKNSTNELYL